MCLNRLRILTTAPLRLMCSHRGYFFFFHLRSFTGIGPPPPSSLVCFFCLSTAVLFFSPRSDCIQAGSSFAPADKMRTVILQCCFPALGNCQIYEQLLNETTRFLIAFFFHNIVFVFPAVGPFFSMNHLGIKCIVMHVLLFAILLVFLFLHVGSSQATPPSLPPSHYFLSFFPGCVFRSFLCPPKPLFREVTVPHF